MGPANHTSADTAKRIPTPSPHTFNPLYIVQAAERAKIVEEEESRVEELRELIRHYRFEYTRITNEIIQSRTQFNTLAYISRLPPEILATIFEIYVVDHWTSYYPLIRQGRSLAKPGVTPYQWIKGVLHVCRQWRRAALSTPQLWTVVAHDRIYEPWRLKFLLEHAGNIPLALRNDRNLVKKTKTREESNDSNSEDLDECDSPGLAFFREVIQKFVRLETLALVVTPEMERLLITIDGEDDSAEDIDAPSMKHLALDLSNEYLSEDPPLLLNVNLPRLKSLTLFRGSPGLVQRLSCPSLTRLDVSLNQYISVSDLLDILESSPGLRQLLVDSVIPDVVREEDVGLLQRVVPLPSLEHIHIACPVPAAGQLLNQLIFPIDTLIELCANGGFPASLLSPIMPAILGHTASCGRTDRAHLVGPRAIRARSRDTDYGSIVTSMWFWRVSESAPAPTSVSVPQANDHDVHGSQAPPTSTLDPARVQCGGLRLNLICPYSRHQLDALDTTELLSLELGPGVFWRTGTSWDIFRRPAFLKLETLRLEGYGDLTEDFFKALVAMGEAATPVAANDDRPSVQDPSTYLPLPSLKTLILCDPWLRIPAGGLLDLAVGGGVLPLLRRCAQLRYRLQLLKITDLGLSHVEDTTATELQEALCKLSIADVVEVTSGSSA